MLHFIRTNFRWIAGGMLLTYFSSFGQTYFISASAAEWQARFDLSYGEFGRLYMIATLGSAICLPFLGRAMDVFSAHRVIAFVIPVLAIASVLAGFAANIPMLILAIFLLRLFGQGMMTHIALTATGRWFAAERGRAVSLVVLGHQGGEATLPLLFTTLAIVYGHQVSWTVAALMLLVIGLPLAWFSYRKPREPHHPELADTTPVSEVRSWTRDEVLRDPIFWILLTGVLAPAFIGTTIFFHQNYMTTLHGWAPQLFATSLAVMAATVIGFALLAGFLIDRYRVTAILPVFLLPLGLACLVLAFGSSPATLYLVMFLTGAAYGFSSTLFGSLWPEIYGVDNLGSIRAVAVSAAVLATAAGPGLTGTLIDVGIGLPRQMVFLSGYCFLAAAAMAFASKRLRQRSG